MKPGTRLLLAAVVLVSLPGGCASFFPQRQASNEPTVSSSLQNAEFSKKKSAQIKSTADDQALANAENTEKPASSTSQDSGFDDATYALIQKELQDATPEERAELMGDLEGVPADLVPRILSVRRMALKHRSQASSEFPEFPASKIPTSAPKTAQGVADQQQYGHSQGSVSASYGQPESESPSMGARSPWNHTARRPTGVSHAHIEESVTPYTGGATITGLKPGISPQSPGMGTSPDRNPVQLGGLLLDDGQQPQLNSPRSLSNQQIPANHQTDIPVTFPPSGTQNPQQNPPPGVVPAGMQTASQNPNGILVPGQYRPPTIMIQGQEQPQTQLLPGQNPAGHPIQIRPGQNQVQPLSSNQPDGGNQIVPAQFQSTREPAMPVINPLYGDGADPSTVYPGNAAGARNDALMRLIALLESEVAVATPGQTEPEQKQYLERHVQLRMLYLMSGQQERALQSIPGVDPADLEFWQYVFWSFSSYFDDRAIPQSADRAAQTVAQLTTAIMKLKARANLELRNVAFCHTISSFGNYERYARDEFSPGQPVMLYAELGNFHSELAADDRYRTLLRSTLEIRKVGPNGELVERIEFRPTEDLCRNHRQDYFHAYEFEIPRKIAFGPHVITLTVEDQLAQKVTTYSLNFTVK